MSISKQKTGRPTKMTRATLGKLREAFLIGSTDEEASVYAEIHPSTLYDYQQQHPEFSEEKEAWKMKPILKARKTVFDNLDNIVTARWFLERKHKAEFGIQDPSENNNKMTLVDLMRELDEKDKTKAHVRTRRN